MEHIPILRLYPHRQIRNPRQIRNRPRRPHNDPKEPEFPDNLEDFSRKRLVGADQGFEFFAAVEEGVFREDFADVVAEGEVRLVVVF